MTLPASGAISWTQICGEFSMPAASSVWPANFYGKGGVPASGALSFSNFYGKSGASPVTVSIAPNPSTNAGATNSFTQNATVTVTGGAATSYSWGVASAINGSGTVVSGGSTATASLRVTDNAKGDGEGASVTFYCDVTVGGVVYRAYCDWTYTWS